MNALSLHLPVLPILVPLAAAAALLVFPDAARALRLTITFASLAVQLAVAVALLYLSTDAVPDVWSEGVGVYAIGGWPAPFGIVLVVDRLSALMLTLTATVGLTALVYSLAHFERPAQPFNALYQLLLMGLNGAFLTGDLFNLFVFFEVLLAASYGLLLRGVGPRRVRNGLHYIAVNLAASLLFLIGVALIYGTLGTLNMADLLGKVALLAPAERSLFDAGAGILGIAFLVKAGSWPLNFWLPGSYSAATPPVSAAFAMLTKVGIYAVLRIGTILGEDEAAAAILGPILFYMGFATLIAGTMGMLATQHLRRLVSYSVIASSGLLLAALGLGLEELTPATLFYLVTSVLTTCAFFMLTGMTDRTRVLASEPAADSDAETDDTPGAAASATPRWVAFGVRAPQSYDTSEVVGAPTPGAMAFLGLMFVCCVLLVGGLPPLPSFVAKFSMLSTVLAQAPGTAGSSEAWALVAGILGSGLAALIALTRIGIRLFWAGEAARRTPRLRMLEAAPVALLVAVCLLLSAFSGPAMRFFDATARSLHAPEVYTRIVLSAGRDGDPAQGGKP
ncbi:MAG TPA: monovalent cation/H+ antiporter subunit D [Gammaproteobacteria bacterium]|nr:monovalent cation/H+ antiporter subunit D [Gammaproteobacteria bacterium]